MPLRPSSASRITRAAAALLVGTATAVAAADSSSVRISVTAGEVPAARGDIVLTATGIRAYAGDLLAHLPSDHAGRHGSGSGTGASSVVSNMAAASGGIAVGEAAVSAPGVATGGDTQPPKVIDANAVKEVVYDFAGNKRIEIDHQNKSIRTGTTVRSSAGAGQSILQGAPAGADPAQLAALQKLLGGFSQDRLDPKRAITMRPAGESGQATVGTGAIACDWYLLSRMGGEFGRVCVAPADRLVRGSAAVELLRGLPMPGADSADVVGFLRQIADGGRLPLVFYDGRYDVPVRFDYLGIGEEQDAPVNALPAPRLAVTEQEVMAALADYRRRRR